MLRLPLFLFLFAMLVSAPAVAQPPSAPTPAAKTRNARAETIDEMVQLAIATARQTEPAPVADPFGNVAANRHFLAMYLIAAQHDALPASDAGKLIDALLTRADKQLGSTSPKSASTTIASKGLVPDILGVAVESGAVNRDVKGTTLTFQITPMGVIKALQNKGLLDIYTDYSQNGAAHIASRFALSASFDTSRGTAGTLTGEGNQLSAWSVRGKIVDGRDPANYAAKWDGLLAGDNSAAYRTAASAVESAFSKWEEFGKWHKTLESTVSTEVDQMYARSKDLPAAVAAFRAVLTDQLPTLAALKPPAPATTAINGYIAAMTRLQAEIDAIYDFAAKGQIFTAEWLTTRDASLPDLFTVTGIYEVGFGEARKSDFTVNAATSFYKDTPQGVEHAFKNFDLNAQLDHPLGKVLRAQSLLFTIAARYSYLPNDSVASTTTGSSSPSGASTSGPALKGHIGVVQFKFTLPVANGVKIPLSITASNRTELIKEKDVRASFGLTFDLDAVLGIVGVK
jgi:hypothetical protein